MLQQKPSIFKDSARGGDDGGSAAALVARQSWQPDQSAERGAESDGSPYTDLGLPVADWTEFLGRILSFGAKAEPLSPPELRARWQEEVASLSELARENHYTNDGDTIGRPGDV